MVKLIVMMGIFSSIFGCNNPGAKIDPNDTITYFSYSEGGGMRRFDGFKYRVEATKDGRVHFLFNEDYPDEKEFTIDDHSVFDSLQQIVLKHKMYKYEGHYQPKFDILDGQSWNFYVKYASGATISAGGYMAGPNGYGEAFQEVINCLNQWKETEAEVNCLVSFDYSYGTTHLRFVPQDDHTEVIIDDEATDRHEVLEKPLETMEELRLIAITEHFRENGCHSHDDPNSIPFKFDLVFSNGDHYVYQSYDLNYKCHKTEVMFWFLERMEIEINPTK